MARTELPNGVILPTEYSDDWYEDMTSNLTKLDDVIGSDSEKLNSNDVAFLRMSSAALTDGGTGNFSDLNSSNKLKTGDYVLDSGRKLYQVVSVDSTNETFTVGNSLFKITAESDLAPVAESGDYDDLDNKPDLKPVATSGDYDDLTDLPTYGITRYCSSAITDNSSIAFSAISSTNKIKVGDFLLDINGKMYQISAVDTDNETVSVTTPLTQLAVDSGVVHLTGSETIPGAKTFSEDIVINNSDTSQTTKRLVIVSSKVNLGDSNSDSWGISFNAGSSYVATINSEKSINSMQGLNFTVRTKDGNNNLISTSYRLRVYTDGSAYLIPSTTDSISLGSSSNKWKDVQTNLVNGLTPSSLSLPANRADSIDISGYFTQTGSGDTNTYDVLANGYIYLQLADVVTVHCFTFEGSSSVATYIQTFSRGNDGQLYVLFPVRKNDTFKSTWYTGSTVTVNKAMLIPCQGNI